MKSIATAAIALLALFATDASAFKGGSIQRGREGWMEWISHEVANVRVSFTSPDLQTSETEAGYRFAGHTDGSPIHVERLIGDDRVIVEIEAVGEFAIIIPNDGQSLIVEWADVETPDGQKLSFSANKMAAMNMQFEYSVLFSSNLALQRPLYAVQSATLDATTLRWSENNIALGNGFGLFDGSVLHLSTTVSLTFSGDSCLIGASSGPTLVLARAE